jgi:hypothetical protein
VPGRTPGEAVEAYAEPIRQTLRCITHSIIGYGGGVYPTGKVNTLTFVNETVAPLKGMVLGLNFSQRYDFFQDSLEQSWKIRTRGYIYTVYDTREEHPREMFAYHWHPHLPNADHPHVHFSIGDHEMKRAHLPTGRISIESIAEFLIRDLGVEPTHQGWKDILKRNRDLFERYRSWT